MKKAGKGRMIATLGLCMACQLACASEAESNKALVREFVEASNALDFATLREIVAPDVVRHSQSTPGIVVTSREDLLAFLEQDAATMEGASVEVRTMVAEGDRVALYGTFSGRQVGNFGPIEPTGKNVSANLHAMFRIDGERIAEFWVLWDNLHVLAQLGHSPFAAADCD